MKHKLLFPIIIVLSLCSCNQGGSPTPPVPPEPIPSTCKNKIILMAGQSNMVGYTPFSDLEGDKSFPFEEYNSGADNVKIVYSGERISDTEFMDVCFGQGRSNSHFGPEVGLTHKLKEITETNYYLAKVAWGASGLVDGSWRSDSSGSAGTMYNYLLDEINNVKDIFENDLKITDYEFTALCWMQGEADGESIIKSTRYEEFFRYFVNDVREYINNDDLYIIDAYISKASQFYNNINSAKKHLSETMSNYFVIDTIAEELNLNPKDIAHYEPYSMIKLGELFGKEVIKL